MKFNYFCESIKNFTTGANKCKYLYAFQYLLNLDSVLVLFLMQMFHTFSIRYLTSNDSTKKEQKF